MKLTKENIQFIDTYLENSDIRYVDVRMEMVDHVASEIETKFEAGNTRDFYNVFKDYMVINKSMLLANNKQFLKATDKKIFKALLKELKKPITVLLFLFLFGALYVLSQEFDNETFRLAISLIPFLGIIGFFFTYIFYQNIKQLKRFSVVERLALPSYCIYEISSIIFNTSKTFKHINIFMIISGLSLVLTLMIVLIKICIGMYKSYNRQFKSI